jgi:hypothetical protein
VFVLGQTIFVIIHAIIALTWLCCAYPPSNTGTGWSGWGNYQSASVNGNQNWAANCDWWCDRQWDVSFPAGQTSTAIFANGMSAPSGFCCGYNIMTTFLGFTGLGLPNGLGYVDDIDTASGNWR